MQARAARRQVLFGGGAAAAAVALPSLLQREFRQGQALLPAWVSPPARRISLDNLHTGDRFDEVYWEKGAYVAGALAEAQRVLRDWRSGEEHFMDPKLFDLLHGIAGKLAITAPFQIVSGYRSPQTNAMLHERSAGVAANSQHVLGKACDICIEGVELANLQKAALSLQAGGVGFYPVSNFVHVDVARVRSWTGV